MTLKSLAGVAVLIASVAGASAQGVPKDFAVKLQRTPCFGACPTYEVTIDANGRVVYKGENNVRISGRATATITREKVAALAAAVDKSGFFSLKDEYDAPVTDFPSTYVTVTSNGRTKRIHDYARAPKALNQLEADIDDIAGTRRWVRIDVPSLDRLFLAGRAPTPAQMLDMMIDALSADDVDVVIALLRRGVSAKTTPDGPHLLAVAGSAAAVQALLAAGADPNAIEAGGETALYRAGEKSVEVVAALLKAGARVETETAPPLHNAACAGNIGAVRLLLDAGANPARKFADRTARECAQEIYEVMKQFPQLWEPPFKEDFAGVIALLDAALAKAKPQQN